MYTKGDWKIAFNDKDDKYGAFQLMVEADKLVIAICDRHGWDNHKERLANAQLIASAPDLYEACLTFSGALAIWQKDPSKAPITLTTIFNETIGKAIAKVGDNQK